VCHSRSAQRFVERQSTGGAGDSDGGDVGEDGAGIIREVMRTMLESPEFCVEGGVSAKVKTLRGVR